MLRKTTSRFLIQFFAIVCIAAGTAAAQPDKLTSSFSSIAKRVEPAVVSIDTKSAVSNPVASATPQPGASDDVMEFFRRQLQQRPVYGVGSGFIVDKSGFIVTNNHVIARAARITVRLESGEEFTAKVIGTDLETDIAVIKIEAPRDLPFVKFGSSTNAEVGDWVLAIGSPFGLTKTVTAGIISQKKRETPYASAFQKFIQTDAAINPGNSGGPLVNLDGDVIGVNSQIATSTGEYSGVGFALPSEEASYVYSQILKNGKVRRGYLGAYLDSVKSEFAKVYGLKDAKGAIVTDIRDKQSAAALAGLQTGDIITQFNGQAIESAADLIARVAATPPDETINIQYLRENGNALDAKTTTIKLGERPSTARAEVVDTERRKLPIDGVKEEKPFGMTLTALTKPLAEKYGFTTEKGLVVTDINPTSYIADVKNSLGNAALGEGDLIVKMNRTAVTDLKTFNDAVAKLKVGDAVVLNVLTFTPQLQGTQLKIVQFTVR